MGSLGDHDDRSDTETQPFDSQSSPPSMPGKKFKDKDFDELQFLQSTLPFVETIPLEDLFETQFMNLAGETQVLDDPDDVDNMGTQLLDDCDDEVVDTDGGGTDRTEVLGDTEELSDDDSVERAGSYPVDQENKLYITISKQDDGGFKAESDGLINEQRNSEVDVSTARLPDKGTPESKPGSVRRNFTSVRAAALRASGLAARSMALKGTHNKPYSIKSGGQSSKQYIAEDNGITGIRESSTFGEEVDQEDFLGKCNEQMKGISNEHKCRVGSSTVRRLFMDDTLLEIEEPDNYTNNADGGADLPQLPACGNEMAGLSYVDSQEPGESSQANALDFVDRFLKFNAMDSDQEVNIGRSTGGKSKPVSSAKGTRSLAKQTNLKSTAGESGIFDWDDSREDEGGGEFFTKKKEAFFNNGGQRQKSFTQPKKLRHLDSKVSGAVYETKDKEERLDIHQKVKGLVNSNSGLVLHNSKRNDRTTKATETKSRKNLTKGLDEQLKIFSTDGMEASGTDKDMPEMLNVGFDTQMAAEAMEVLCFGSDVADHDNKDTNQDTKNMYEGSSGGEKENRARSKKDFLLKRSSLSSSGVFKRNLKQKKSIGTKLSKKSTVSSLKKAENVRKQCDTELVKAELKKAKSNAKGRFATNWIENIDKVPSKVIEQIEEERALKGNDTDEVDRCHVIASSVRKRCLQEQVGTFTPIARRTRQCRITNQLRDGDAFTMLSSKEKISKLDSNLSGELKNGKLAEQGKLHQRLTDTIASVRIDELSYCRRRRTHRKSSGQLNGSCNLHGSVSQFVGQESDRQSLGTSNRTKTNTGPSMDLGMKRKTRSSAHVAPVLPNSDRHSEGSLFQQRVGKRGSLDADVVPKDVVGALASKQSYRQSDADTKSAEVAGGNARLEASPGDRCKPSGSASITPVNCLTPINAASPICMGDEYLKQSCRKNLSRSFLMKEINSLISNGPEPTSTTKDLRRRRDMANVRVLFSQHLDEDIIKQQKKILARLGASTASSISEATHFITEKFVRTRNMLEAIAFGKPVVTHLWLESCGQASCFIDERNYILRDAKKEKEFGFSLPVSLARACQHPLLQGQKVFITSNTKPGKEILVSLVKAVHGLAVERIGRSVFKDDKIPDDLLVLSCEEDYDICVPFLEKGAAVYSSELLLNGIVTQKLECERHRLFVDHVKRTRSTIWLKRDSNHYMPVTKPK